jgi:cytoskeletal protein RodZ
MYALSVLSVVAAIATLAVGFVTDLVWIYVSIGLSILAALLLFFSVLRRRPVEPATAGAPYGPAVGTPEARGRAATAKSSATAPVSPAAQRRPATPTPTTAPARKPAAKKTAAKKPAAKKTAAKTTTKTAAKKTAAKKTTATRNMVVAIPERGTYHKADCRYVQGRTDTERLNSSTAKSRGFKACGVCKP